VRDDLLTQLADYGRTHQVRQESVEVSDVVGRAATANVIDMSEEISVSGVARSNRRSRRRRLILAVAVIVVVVGAAGLAIGNSRHRRQAPVVTNPSTTIPPTTHPRDVAVWYDARGLHHGNVVERTPVKLTQDVGDMVNGALALVRSGAMYLNPATGDVWFHPWGGTPRIVGHNSSAGPGGDPNGDTAAWFEGDTNSTFSRPELVVYDTAAGREISRTREGNGVVFLGGDHWPAGNTFLQVSAERVVWWGYGNDGSVAYGHDVRTRKSSLVTDHLLDVHDDVRTLGSPASASGWVLQVPGRAEQRYPKLENRARLSPSGAYVLSVQHLDEPHAAAIVDTRTGEQWAPRVGYPWIAWSYDDVALIDTNDALIACDATRRVCARVNARRPFLMPTN